MIKKLGLSYIQRLLIAIVFALILLSAWWTGASLLDLVRTQRALDEAHGAVHVADALLRQVIDAETGQRGMWWQAIRPILPPTMPQWLKSARPD